MQCQHALGLGHVKLLSNAAQCWWHSFAKMLGLGMRNVSIFMDSGQRMSGVDTVQAAVPAEAQVFVLSRWRCRKHG